MEQNLIDRLSTEDKNALRTVASLLNQAQSIWNQIDSGKQCELNAEHNEEGSLAHALRWGTQAAEELVTLTSGKETSETESQNKITTILLHRISWFLRGDTAPDELDDCSIEHIEERIKEGYNQGELCVIGNDGDTEYRGWWSIEGLVHS